VIVPEDVELAVLKGAVLFGHKPDYIVARIARYTYGVECRNDFNPDIHEPGRCIVVNGQKECDSIFDMYMKTGSVVELGAKTLIYSKLQHHFKVEYHLISFSQQWSVHNIQM
jgi:hypothetical protein